MTDFVNRVMWRRSLKLLICVLNLIRWLHHCRYIKLRSSLDLDIINCLAVASVAMRWFTSSIKSCLRTGVSNRFGFERDSANLNKPDKQGLNKQTATPSNVTRSLFFASIHTFLKPQSAIEVPCYGRMLAYIIWVPNFFLFCFCFCFIFFLDAHRTDTLNVSTSNIYFMST